VLSSPPKPLGACVEVSQPRRFRPNYDGQMMRQPAALTSLSPALAGAAATFSGIGLARFAYVPLFPAMLAAGWVTGPEGGLLGAMNLAGYLIGVLGGRGLAARLGTARALDAGMALVGLAFAACAWNGGVAWLAVWRLLAGLAGGALMALAGPAVQGAVAPARRGTGGGIVVTGVGGGVITASLLIPWLLPAGLSATWLALAAFVIALWLLAHPRWPQTPVAAADLGAPRAKGGALIFTYGLAGAGMVPHMVYFADYAVRACNLDPRLAALMWLLFGIGAITGTLAGGRAADRWGAAWILKISLALQVTAIAAALNASLASLVVSALLGGFAGLGITAVVLARARELAGPAAGILWVRATALYALAQATTGFALVALFAHTNSYTFVFGTCLLLSLAALLVSVPDR
jgi:predicted MFS family arabinose efflux permease